MPALVYLYMCLIFCTCIYACSCVPVCMPDLVYLYVCLISYTCMYARTLVGRRQTPARKVVSAAMLTGLPTLDSE